MKIIRSKPFDIRWGYYSKLASRNISKTVRRMISNGKWAILSAQRGRGYDVETGAINPTGRQKDRDAHGQLKDLLQEHGIGFIDQQVGFWGPDEQTPDAPKFPEDSLFIPNISFDLAIKIARKFHQLQIIYGNNGQYAFYDVKNGNMLGEARPVKTDFEHLTEPIRPGWNPNYTSSDGERWRLADPEQHLQRRKDLSIEPQVPESAPPPARTAAAEPIMSFDCASPTHFFYAWQMPFKFGAQADVVSAYAAGSWPADKLLAWLPLVKE